MAKPIVTEITSDAQWHELRAKNIGASEVAALFDQSPWITRFTLWHQKAGRIPYNSPEGDMRMNIGKRIEPFIAELVADSLNLDLWRSKAYYEQPAERIGCTLDFSFDDPEFGPAIVETKNVDWLQFKQNWGETRPPLMYQFQMQHQFAVTGRRRGVLAAFVGGNELKLYDVKPDEKVIAEIRRRAFDFWGTIDSNNSPEPTGTADEVDLFKELFPDVKDGKPITLDSHEVAQACHDHEWSSAQLRMGKEGKDRATAIILNAMEDNGHAIAPGYRIKLSRTPNKHGTITQRLTVKADDTGVMVKPDDVRPFG